MGRCGRDRMLVGFTTTCAISAHHHLRFEFESRAWRSVLNTTLCDKICQWLATGSSFSPGTPVSSSTNKTEVQFESSLLLFDLIYCEQKSLFCCIFQSNYFFFIYYLATVFFCFSNKNHHDITELLLKVALNTINQTHVSFADFHTWKKCSNTTMKCHIIEI